MKPNARHKPRNQACAGILLVTKWIRFMEVDGFILRETPICHRPVACAARRGADPIQLSGATKDRRQATPGAGFREPRPIALREQREWRFVRGKSHAPGHGSGSPPAVAADRRSEACPRLQPKLKTLFDNAALRREDSILSRRARRGHS